MMKRLQVFDIIVLVNTAFVLVGSATTYAALDPEIFNGFLAGGLLGWLNNLAFRTAFRVIATHQGLWRVGVFFFVFLFSFKLLLNFYAIYFFIMELGLGGLSVLSGLLPAMLSIIIGSLVYGRRLKDT